MESTKARAPRPSPPKTTMGKITCKKMKGSLNKKYVTTRINKRRKKAKFELNPRKQIVLTNHIFLLILNESEARNYMLFIYLIL